MTGEKPLHSAYISIGSNIEPDRHIREAIRLLRTEGKILAFSSVWETEAVGSGGPNFLNAAVAFETPFLRQELKERLLHVIENRLGRVRSADKNAPRTIDLDVIIFDGQVVDNELWGRLYIARPFAELLPDLVNPITGQTLLVTADALHQHGYAVIYPGLIDI